MKRNKNTNSFKRNGMTDTEREIIQSRAGLEIKDGQVDDDFDDFEDFN